MLYTDYSPKISKSIIEDTIDALENDFKAQELADMNTETLYNHAHDLSHQVMDNMVIYYSDAFQIVQRLGVCNWEHFNNEYGQVDNISQLAYLALNEYIQEHGILFNIVKHFID